MSGCHQKHEDLSSGDHEYPMFHDSIYLDTFFSPKCCSWVKFDLTVEIAESSWGWPELKRVILFGSINIITTMGEKLKEKLLH